MALIPVRNILEHELDNPQIEQLPRHYLGMSQIGGNCDRALQYYFRWADTSVLERRIQRLFDFGHIAEDQFTKELERVGCVIDSQQQEYIGFAGHWKGHSDGRIHNVPGKDPQDAFLLEYKTHNDKNFKILKKDKVKEGYPGHYDQCQRYLAEHLELAGAMYIGYNKNDSDYYIEFIDHDVPRQTELKRKEQHILLEPQLFGRIGTGQITWFECLYCNFKKVCFDRKPVRKGCRTCKNVEVKEDGSWMCMNPGPLEYLLLPTDTQATGCADWELDKEFFGG